MPSPRSSASQDLVPKRSQPSPNMSGTVQSSVRALRVAGQEMEAVFRPASWAASYTVGTFTVWSLSNTGSHISATVLPVLRSK